MSLGKTFNAISHLGVKQSTRCGGPALRKTCKQNSLSDMTDTEHSTTSRSNEEEEAGHASSENMYSKSKPAFSLFEKSVLLMLIVYSFLS